MDAQWLHKTFEPGMEEPTTADMLVGSSCITMTGGFEKWTVPHSLGGNPFVSLRLLGGMRGTIRDKSGGPLHA